MFLYNRISCLICDSPSLTMTTSIPGISSSARCVFITIHSATGLHFEASQKCRGTLLVVVFALLSVRKQTSALTARIAPSPPCNHYSFTSRQRLPVFDRILAVRLETRSRASLPKVPNKHTSRWQWTKPRRSRRTMTIEAGSIFYHIWKTLVKSEAVRLPPSLTVSHSSGSFSPSKLFS